MSSCEGKIEALACKLKVHVLDLIDDADQAREMIAEHMKLGSFHTSQIARMAELYYENPINFGIRRRLKEVGGHPERKRSAIREAIANVLREFIEATDKMFDADALSGAEFPEQVTA